MIPCEYYDEKLDDACLIHDVSDHNGVKLDDVCLTHDISDRSNVNLDDICLTHNISDCDGSVSPFLRLIFPR